jgi:trimeric autotransporter adhesin
VGQGVGADGSFSDVNQNGDGNTVAVTQNGADSDSFAYQYDGGNHANVTQNGDRSVSTMIQYGGYAGQSGGLNNQANVTQNGADTYSYLAQGGRDNVADVSLSGTGDPNPRRSSSSEYAGSPDPATGVAAESEVWQEGLSNKAAVEQIADSANARIYQGTDERNGYAAPGTGLANDATIRQYAGATDSRADIYQDGVANVATTLQTASSSTAMVRQDGLTNISLVDQQSGSGHVADVTQYANGNFSSVVQNGTGNTATVGQYSDGNVSTVNQGGSGNAATVTQGGL